MPEDPVQSLTPEDLQKAASRWGVPMPSLQAPENPGTPNIDTPGAGESLFRGVTQNLPMAAVGGYAGGPLMAGMMGMFPPQDAASAAGDALSIPIAGVGGQLEKLAKGWFGRTIARGGMGVGQAELDSKMRDWLQAEKLSKNTGNKSLLQKTISLVSPTFGAAALPMILGGAGDVASSAAKFGQTKFNVEDMLSKYGVNGVEDIPNANPAGTARPTLQQMQENYAQKVPQIKVAQAAQQVATKQLAALQKERAELATAIQSSSSDAKSYENYRNALLSKNADERDKYLKLTGVGGQELGEANVRLGLIQQAQDNLSLVNQGINPYDTTQKLAPGEADALRKQYQDAIDQHKFMIWSGKEDELRQASDQNAQAQKMYDTSNPVVKGLQDTIDRLNKEVAENPFENSRLQNLIVNRSGNPLGAQEFIKNLEGASSEDIRALMQHLGSYKDGEGLIKNVQDAMITQMLASAYNGKAKNLSNITKLIGAGGPYSQDKLVELFGGGQTGRDAFNATKQMLQDIRYVTEGQPRPMGQVVNPLSFKGQAIAAVATGLLHHSMGMSYSSAAMAGEAAATVPTILSTGYARLFRMASENPKLANQFHTWAMKGGSMEALKATPELQQWMEKNSVSY